MTRFAQGLRLALVATAALATIPALLSGAERLAALAKTGPSLGVSARSLDGARRQARALLAARQFAAAEIAARAIVARAPLDRNAQGILVGALAGQGRVADAEQTASTAALLSWRDPAIQLWMYDGAVARGAAAEAAQHADAIARIDAFRDFGFAEIAGLLPRRGGAEAVAAQLAAMPPWRGFYFGQIAPANTADADALLHLLAALSRSPAPPTADESARVLWSVVSRGYGDRAWVYWTARHPVGGALIDDPDFTAVRTATERSPPSPFVWTIPAAAPVGAVASRDRAGRRALLVEHHGERTAMFVSRYVGIPPGRYLFSYRASGQPDELDRIRPDASCRGRGSLKVGPVTSDGTQGEARYSAPIDVSPGCGLVKVGFSVAAGEATTPATSAIRSVALAAVR